ncbi:MAG: glycerol-3-phosphate 1-O-acyltransferase PlsY [Thermodesulfobacteriota bacterium]
MTLTEIAIIVAAYLIGSIPTGVIVARIMGAKDPRSVGSGNIGATNVGRSAGKAAGIITLFGDCCKGALPTVVALYLLPSVYMVAVVGFAAFLGHLFPVFLGFRGGKGVATALGIFLVISPLATLISVVIFVILLLLFRYVSLASMAAAAALPAALALLPGTRPFTPLGVVVGALIIIKHGGNIRRLVAGSENRMGGKR